MTKKKNPGEYVLPRWSEEDKALLTELVKGYPYNGVTFNTICTKLDRPGYGVDRMMRDLKLPRVPEGFMLFAHASKKFGFDKKQMKLILEMGEVEVYNKLTAPPELFTGRRSKKVRNEQIVNVQEAHDAVDFFLSTESFSQGVKERGISRFTARKVLKKRGQLYLLGKDCRAETAVLDALVEEFARLPKRTSILREINDLNHQSRFERQTLRAKKKALYDEREELDKQQALLKAQIQKLKSDRKELKEKIIALRKEKRAMQEVHRERRQRIKERRAAHEAKMQAWKKKLEPKTAQAA